MSTDSVRGTTVPAASRCWAKICSVNALLGAGSTTAASNVSFKTPLNAVNTLMPAVTPASHTAPNWSDAREATWPVTAMAAKSISTACVCDCCCVCVVCSESPELLAARRRFLALALPPPPPPLLLPRVALTVAWK